MDCGVVLGLSICSSTAKAAGKSQTASLVESFQDSVDRDIRQGLDTLRT